MKFKCSVIVFCFMLSIAALAGCANSNENNELGKAAATGAGSIVEKAKSEIDGIFQVSLGETFTCPNRYQIHFDSYEFMDELKVGHETLKQRKDGVHISWLRVELKTLGQTKAWLVGAFLVA